MGYLDDFLYQHFGSQLRQGEQIIATGHLRRHKGDDSVSGRNLGFEDFLAIATNQRLVLWLTNATGDLFRENPKGLEPQCLEVIEWDYFDLESATIGAMRRPFTGTGFYLTPHPTMGPFRGMPRNYGLYMGVEGLDGQQYFMTQYPGWLGQQIAQGAFPPDPARLAIITQHRQQAAAELAGKDKKTAEMLAMVGLQGWDGADKANKGLLAGAGVCVLLLVVSFASVAGLALPFTILLIVCLILAKRVRDYRDRQPRQPAPGVYR